jgi:hypothetical protein
MQLAATQSKDLLLYCRGDGMYVHYPAYVFFALTGLKKVMIDGAPFAFV